MTEQPFRAKPCPTCGVGFPAPARHGVITCANGHGWTVGLASALGLGDASWTVVPAVDDQAALDRAAADMAVRDDLAREVAREWATLSPLNVVEGAALCKALDRLAAAYGEDR